MFYYQELHSALFNFSLSTNSLAVYAVFIAFVLSLSFLLRRLFITTVAVEFAFCRLVLIATIISRLHCQVVRLFDPLIIVVLLRRSEPLSVCHPSPTIMVVDFALGRLILQQVVKLFGFLVVVALLRRSGPLFVYRLFLATVALKFASGRLMLQSNRCSYIQFASLSYRVIQSFCCCCFVVAFQRSIYRNVS